MLILKRLRLKNYCNFSDYTFDFMRENGTPYPFVCFFGPNGIGKSSLLDAVAKLSMNTSGRSNIMVRESLQKYVRNKDYDPQYNRIKGYVYKDDFIAGASDEEQIDMLIEGTFELYGREFIVQVTQDGYARNDLAKCPEWGENHLKYRQRINHFITSDSDLSMSKFQLHLSQMKNFEDIISEIMRYPAECIPPSELSFGDDEYCTDFIIKKKDFRIHYKRMSAGERKICKSFSQILNLLYDLEQPKRGEIAMPGWPRLLLVDNVEMHVYYDRHVTLVECLKRVFEKQQIICTTHSGTLIKRFLDGENDKDKELFFDLEKIN